MHFDMKKRKYEQADWDIFEHPADYLEGEVDEFEDDWTALAVQAGYDGVFDEQKDAE